VCIFICVSSITPLCIGVERENIFSRNRHSQVLYYVTYIHTYRQTRRQAGRHARHATYIRTDRQTGRKAGRQNVHPSIQTDRQIGRKAGRQIFIVTCRQTDRQAGRQAGRHAYVHTYIHTDRQTCIQIGTKADRQTFTYLHECIQTQTDRQTDTNEGRADILTCRQTHIIAPPHTDGDMRASYICFHHTKQTDRQADRQIN